MFPGMNPRDMEKAMKKLGIKQEAIEASEVIIRTPSEDMVIENPQVTKVNMMGQDTFQIVGTVHSRVRELFSDDDVKTVMDQTGRSAIDAKKALSEEGDLAAAILKLQQ